MEMGELKANRERIVLERLRLGREVGGAGAFGVGFDVDFDDGFDKDLKERRWKKMRWDRRKVGEEDRRDLAGGAERRTRNQRGSKSRLRVDGDSCQ